MTFYKDYAGYMREFFGSRKVQKISVNRGGTCPNRDGTLGRGGCIYCNNSSFTPSYCLHGKSVEAQIAEGKEFFRRKYPSMGYMPYFQSYTSTYGESDDIFCDAVATAVAQENVVGIVVGTRPDCLPRGVVETLASVNRQLPVFVELGVESMHADTLKLINRGHTPEAVVNAVNTLSEAGLHSGVHLIAGLPGEDEGMMLDTIRRVCNLPVESIKLHHLQILKGTPLAGLIASRSINVRTWELEDYLDFCIKVIDTVPRNIAIERFTASAPADMVIAPKWGLKNHEFVNLLNNRLKTLRNKQI